MKTTQTIATTILALIATAAGGTSALAALHAHLRRRRRGPVGSPHRRLELLAVTGRVHKTELLGEVAWQAQAA